MQRSNPQDESQKNITLNDVAAHCGVSYQTVSRVINNHPNVAEQTRSRVLKSIKALNYSPNQAARSLVTKRSDTIGVISIDTSYSFYGPSQVVGNITQRAREGGYRVTLSTIAELTHSELESTVEDLRSQQVDGIIVIAPIISEHLGVIRDMVGNIPLVKVDAMGEPGVATVAMEQGHGTQLATEHLLSLGHRHIAEISGPLNWYSAVLRHERWIATMQAHDLPHHMSVMGDWTARSGYEAAKALLKQGSNFTGIFAANDQMALGAIAALHEAGLRVPNHVSVVGYDDLPEAAYYLPALTTIRQDFRTMGDQSVDYLISLMRNPNMPLYQRTLYPELIVRESTRSVH